jgi:hypothetical protein
MKYVVELLISIIIVLKFFFLFSTLRKELYPIVHANDEYINIINNRNEKILDLTETLIYILIIILFFPNKNHVYITGHKKLILFSIGVLGLLHTKWNKISEINWLLHPILK